MVLQRQVNINDVTSDSMFNGAVICKQHRYGYRFSIDAVLTAHFHQLSEEEVVLDLGAGCGIISLILRYRWGKKISSLCALEYQAQLVRLINDNFKTNGFVDTCMCIEGDVKGIRHIIKPESYSFVVCNPPFYSPSSGRSSVGEEAKIARHEVHGNLKDFVNAAAWSVKNGGTVVFIYPAEQFTRLAETLSVARLEIKKTQFIYSYPDVTKSARLVLVKCIKNGGKGVVVKPPFYIYVEKNGEYSKEMQNLYRP